MIQGVIVNALRGSSGSHPVELWELAEAIDASLRLIPEAGVVEAALHVLAAHGRVRELPGHRYVDGEEAAWESVVSPITGSEWAAALATYRTWFEAELREMGDPDGIDGLRFPSVVLTLAVGPDGPAAAADLMAKLQEAVADRLTDEDLIAITPDPVIDGKDVVGTVATTDRKDGDRIVAIAEGAIEHMRPAGLSVRYADWEL